MQRNQHRSLCIECRLGVRKYGGFIYYPGGRNLVVCDDCIYRIYGVGKGFLTDRIPTEEAASSDRDETGEEQPQGRGVPGDEA